MHEKGLEHFYEIKRAFLAGIRSEPQARSYEELDAPELSAALQISGVENDLEVTLNLDGIHCSGCLWVLERLPQFHPGIHSARVNLGDGSIRLRVDRSKTSISAIAATLNSLGYPTRIPSLGADVVAREERVIARNELLRLAAAGFSAANTMLLAVSLFQGYYTGIDAVIGHLFRWLSALLSIPALWAAWPMTRNALQTLKHRQLHLDLPVVAALWTAFLLSLLNTILARPYVYFDSLCTIVFLLLIGKRVQGRAVRRAQRECQKQWTFFPLQARTIDQHGLEKMVSVHTLSPGMLLRIKAQERIPADVRVKKGSSSIDRSVITGESTPVAVTVGDCAEAGQLNIDAEIRIGKSIAFL